MDQRLCSTLQPVLEWELSRGNCIESIEAPAGTNCPFLMNLKNKMDHTGLSNLLLPSTVEKWENKDRHYPLQSGYTCSKYRHSIAGPL